MHLLHGCMPHYLRSLAGQALQAQKENFHKDSPQIFRPWANLIEQKCTIHRGKSSCLANLCSLRRLGPVMQGSSAPEVILPIPGCPVQIIKPSHSTVVHIELLMVKVMEVWLGLCLK